jgi:hypothetical protein
MRAFGERGSKHGASFTYSAPRQQREEDQAAVGERSQHGASPRSIMGGASERGQQAWTSLSHLQRPPTRLCPPTRDTFFC